MWEREGQRQSQSRYDCVFSVFFFLLACNPPPITPCEWWIYESKDGNLLIVSKCWTIIPNKTRNTTAMSKKKKKWVSSICETTNQDIKLMIDDANELVCLCFWLLFTPKRNENKAVKYASFTHWVWQYGDISKAIMGLFFFVLYLYWHINLSLEVMLSHVPESWDIAATVGLTNYNKHIQQLSLFMCCSFQ